jgi:hypothetical protein
MCATRSRSLARTPRGTPRVSTPTLDLLSQVAAASAAKEGPAAAVLAARHTATTPPPLAFFSDARPMMVHEAGLESPVFYRAKAAEDCASDACAGAGAASGVLSSVPASPMSPLKGLELLG